MCGLIGYQAKTPQAWHFDILAKLLRESTVRGAHAFGMSYLRDGKLATVKSHKLDDLISLFGSPGFRERPPYALIAQTRYALYGEASEHSNNEPLVTIEPGETVAMIHNGSIHSGRREDWVEEFGGRYLSDNDGEIVLREYVSRSTSDFLRWFNKQRFAFAGMFLSTSTGLSYIRNRKRPLWFTETDSDFSFYASTRDILARAQAPGDYCEQLPNALSRCTGTLEKIREDARLYPSSPSVGGSGYVPPVRLGG